MTKPNSTAQPPRDLPSLPWTWTGGYPQRITGPDATLIAEVFESPDATAVIAPTICEAVNEQAYRDELQFVFGPWYPEEDS